MKTRRSITLLVFLLSVCTHAAGQKIWQPDTETLSEGVRIQNSLPRGGLRYKDSTGKDFVYVIFWTRVVNETAAPLVLTINFPADSFAIPATQHSYAKLFLSPDPMTVDKQAVFDYGLTGLKPFLDVVFYKPTRLQQTIRPKEEYVFYSIILSYLPHNGAVRAGFVLKESELFYRINMLDPTLIPCGKVVFKK